ncbi:MAG: twin-arginine translocase TatA/TatE family subunit [Dongiaceae bacterium]
MGSFSIWHWLIVLAVVLILFGGGGKISKVMKDFGQGVTAFKRGLKEDQKEKAEGEEGDKVIDHKDTATVASAVHKDKAAS